METKKYEEIEADIISYLKSKSLIPILGAGFSAGSRAKNGEVPSVSDFTKYMIEQLMNSEKIPDDYKQSLKNNGKDFKEILSIFEDNEYINKDLRLNYYIDNFSNVTLSDEKKKILQIEWEYIYTLNIDDAIEKNSGYDHVVISNRIVNDDIYNKYPCVIKLHGDINDIVTYRDSECKIFTDKEYAISMRKNISLLDKLDNDYKFQNILFFGCSLTNEFDLEALTSLPLDSSNIDLSRRIIFMINEPDFDMKNKLKKYEITDVVVFNNYSEMYEKLYQSWIKSKEIQNNELEKYCNIKINHLSKNDDHKEYFFFGKSLYDIKKKQINLPYYFIHRTMLEKIIPALNENKVILIQGNSLSGKSYFLIDIYISVRDRNVYYFDGRTKVNRLSIEKLLNKKNIVVLFDIGSITREEFEFILEKSDKVNENGNSFIILLSLNNSDYMGIVKIKLIKHEINEKNITRRNLCNIFDKYECPEINRKLPVVNIPIFSQKKNIIDNIVYIENDLVHKGKFSDVAIRTDSVYDLVLYIIFATKERIYSFDLINFGLLKELSIFMSRYPEFIEEINSDLVEKEASNLSSIKYVINAKFWLQEQLSIFAKSKNNYEIIADAYNYIVDKILEYAGGINRRSREMYREYILFDTINNIFVKSEKDNLYLIILIYNKLYKTLATDYQFLHQYSKGYLMCSYRIYDNVNKMIYLHEALEKIIIAQSIVQNNIELLNDENKNTAGYEITMAHMKFTKSIINCEICCVEKFENMTNNINALLCLYDAMFSTYLFDDLLKSRLENKNGSIEKFVNQCVNVEFEKIQNNKLTEIRERIRNINTDSFKLTDSVIISV